MRVFPQERTRTDNDINTVNTSLDGQSGVIHVASDMGQDLGLFQAERANGLAVVEGFGRGGGRGEFDVFDTEFVEAVSERASEQSEKTSRYMERRGRIGVQSAYFLSPSETRLTPWQS